MKKIIGIVAVAAMVASGAFADITFGAWGRSGVNLMEKTNTSTKTESVSGGTSATTDDSTNPDATTATTPSWAQGSRVGFNVAGQDADGNIGFKVNVDSNGNAIGIGDEAKVWGKIGWVTAEFGQIQLNDLRGSIGDWGNRDIGSKSEDDIFTRFYPKHGMTLELRPVDGLFIGGMIDTGSTSAVKAEDVYKSAAGGVGYTIKDVAQIKAAYFGSSTDDHYGRLEFGVDLLMIKDNLIEIGAKLPMAKDNADGYFNVCVGFSGSADKLSYKGHIYGDFTKTTKIMDVDGINTKFTFDDPVLNTVAGLDAGMEYDLGMCSVGLTAKYNITMANGKETIFTVELDDGYMVNNIGAELYLKKGFGNGYLFAGVADELKITSYTQKLDSDNNGTTTVTNNTFSIPVGAEYWF